MPTSPFQTDESPRPVMTVTITTRHVAWLRLFCVALCLSLFILKLYAVVYQPRYGWTRLIIFGANAQSESLPRLQRTPHYVVPATDAPYGYDGQFYAQMAIDPSLRDPAFDHALDGPAYRARRIGLPALAFALGWGKPRRILQAYALSNLLFWFVLLGALAILYRPWTGRRLLCLSASMVTGGVLVSMERSLTDLPAAAMIFVGVVLGSWGGYAALAGAVLTRETSVLAAVGLLDWRFPWRGGAWKRQLAALTLAVAPLAVWLIYIHGRFPDVHRGEGGPENFAPPLQAMGDDFMNRLRQFGSVLPTPTDRAAGRLGWLYENFFVHEMLTIAALGFQGLYFALRWDKGSAFWRMGVCYLALGVMLGPAVWEDTGAAARVLLPMTLCFYLLLARERAGWFWPFFLLGSLSFPYAVHKYWSIH